MDSNESKYLAVCASSLLHDLAVIRHCVGYHACCSSNPFSVRFRDELDNLHLMVNHLQLELDDYLANNFFNDKL